MYNTSRGSRKAARRRHLEHGVATHVVVNVPSKHCLAFPDTHQCGPWCDVATPQRDSVHPRWTEKQALDRAQCLNHARQNAWREFLDG
jgi:hypothetical protein